MKSVHVQKLMGSAGISKVHTGPGARWLAATVALGMDTVMSVCHVLAHAGLKYTAKGGQAAGG